MDKMCRISDFPGLSMGIFVSIMPNSVSVRPRAPHELTNDVWCAGFGRRGVWQPGGAWGANFTDFAVSAVLGHFWVIHYATSNHNVTCSDRLKAYEWSGRVYAIGGAP